jgi:hypothetical protein
MRQAIGGSPRQSEAIRGNQRPSEALGGNQEAIRGHQRTIRVRSSGEDEITSTERNAGGDPISWVEI